MSGPLTSDYREFRPAPPLSPFVVCTWTQRIGAGIGAYPQRVLPDGCIDIVWSDESPAVVVGPATRAFQAPLPSGSTHIGVRFRPGLAPVLLGTPVGFARDCEVPLVDLWGATAQRLAEQIAEQATAPARIGQIEAALIDRLRLARPADEVVVAAVAWMAAHPTGRIARLGRALDISSRQLHRRFHDAVGYAPKTLQRILRFQRLLELARPGGPRRDLAFLAIEAGYADQAHMSRDVRELSSLTPTTLLENGGSALAMADFFKTGTVEPPIIPSDSLARP